MRTSVIDRAGIARRNAKGTSQMRFHRWYEGTSRVVKTPGAMYSPRSSSGISKAGIAGKESLGFSKFPWHKPGFPNASEEFKATGSDIAKLVEWRQVE
jgi:hypothetical protein